MSLSESLEKKIWRKFYVKKFVTSRRFYKFVNVKGTIIEDTQISGGKKQTQN